MATTTVNPAVRPERHIKHSTFGQALVSEWTKIRTVRSTFWNLLIGAVLTVGFTVLITASIAAHVRNQPGDAPRDASVDLAMIGLFFGQIPFAVLGAMTITAEYSTGMIRTSLSAVPKRGRLLAAKAIVFAFVAYVVGTITSIVSFLVGEALLAGAPAMRTQSLGDPGVLRAVLGGGLYLTVISLLALGVGLLLRHTAGAITTMLALMLVPSIFGGLLPDWWQIHVIRYLPTNAGARLMSTTPGRMHELSPWAGFTTLCVWAVVALTAGFVLFKRRDA